MILCVYRKGKTSFECYEQPGLPLVEMLKGTYGHNPMNCMILCIYKKGKTSFESYEQLALQLEEILKGNFWTKCNELHDILCLQKRKNII